MAYPHCGATNPVASQHGCSDPQGQNWFQTNRTSSVYWKIIRVVKEQNKATRGQLRLWLWGYLDWVSSLWDFLTGARLSNLTHSLVHWHAAFELSRFSDSTMKVRRLTLYFKKWKLSVILMDVYDLIGVHLNGVHLIVMICDEEFSIFLFLNSCSWMWSCWSHWWPLFGRWTPWLQTDGGEEQADDELILKHVFVSHSCVQPVSCRWGQYGDWSVCDACSSTKVQFQYANSRLTVTPVTTDHLCVSMRQFSVLFL